MADIDISKLKVPELKDHLKKMGIEPPKSAKKGDLVKLIQIEKNKPNGSGESVDPMPSLVPESEQNESFVSQDESIEEPTLDNSKDDNPIAETCTAVDDTISPMETAESHTKEEEVKLSESEVLVAEQTSESKAEDEDKHIEDGDKAVEEATEEKSDVVEEPPMKKVKSNEDESDKAEEEPDLEEDKESVVEDLPDLEAPSNEDNVELDRYNCDLHFKVHEDAVSGEPSYTSEGFAFLYAGARATYGMDHGKFCFEMLVESNIQVDHLPIEETLRHASRIGVSTRGSNLQLGEDVLSWGYGSMAKISNDRVFTDYGELFAKGNAIGCFVDMQSDPIVISYTKNGEYHGVAFKIKKADLGDEALFPHILCKNVVLQLNFGQRDEPFYPPLDGYTYINNFPKEERIRGYVAPESKKDCEVLMMVGLPSSGKSYWSVAHAVSNPEKRYNILGFNQMNDKMRILGKHRKKNWAGSRDVLVQASNSCVSKLLEDASSRKRNYIIDQTNIYEIAQRRKLQPFVGFNRTLVMMVPDDDTYKERVKMHQEEDDRKMSESAVLEMKANIEKPKVSQLIKNIMYPEQDEEKTLQHIDAYNTEAKENGVVKSERRWSNRNRNFGGRRDDKRDRRDVARKDARGRSSGGWANYGAGRQWNSPYGGGNQQHYPAYNYQQGYPANYYQQSGYGGNYGGGYYQQQYPASQGYYQGYYQQQQGGNRGTGQGGYYQQGYSGTGY